MAKAGAVSALAVRVVRRSQPRVFILTTLLAKCQQFGGAVSERPRPAVFISASRTNASGSGFSVFPHSRAYKCWSLRAWEHLTEYHFQYLRPPLSKQHPSSLSVML